MKKQLIYILAATLLFGMTISCDNNGGCNCLIKYYRSYIDAFIKSDSLIFRISNGMVLDKVNKVYRQGDDNSEGIHIYINGNWPSKSIRYDYPTNIFYPEEWKTVDRSDVNFTYYRKIHIQYDEYIEQIGDKEYKRNISNKRIVVATVSPLKEVVVTADKSFNKYFPLGADLSPLFYILFDDVYATVKSGYKAAPDTYKYRPEIFQDYRLTDSPMSVRCLKLSETNLEKYPFTEAKWELFLDAKPEKTDSYTFHVKFTFADGTVLEGDAPAITIKGVN